MPKVCLNTECKNFVFGGGYCKNHQYLRQDKKQKEPKRGYTIKKVSAKRQKETVKYLNKRLKFLEGKICPITGRSATEIHHMNGREGERLNDEKYWLAVTREGHMKIHANPEWSRENNYLI